MNCAEPRPWECKKVGLPPQSESASWQKGNKRCRKQAAQYKHGRIYARGIDGPHASQRVATTHPERSAEIFITAADSWQIYDRHLVNLRPPRAHIYVLCPTVFASPSRTVAIPTRDRKRACDERIESESTRRRADQPGFGGRDHGVDGRLPR